MSDEITTFPRLYDEPDAIPFINSIVLNPDDDTNRIVFADWLEENAYRDDEFADHYRARCEFIRVGCQSLGGSLKRISKAEGEWLDENWRRLVPTFSRWLQSSSFVTQYVADYYFMKRNGRQVTIRTGMYQQKESRWLGAFDAIRGFTRFATYNSQGTPQYRTLLMDDPVADPFRYATKQITNKPIFYQVTNNGLPDDVMVLHRCDMPMSLFRNFDQYFSIDGLTVKLLASGSCGWSETASFQAEDGQNVHQLAILAIHRAMRKWVKEKNFKVSAFND